VAQAKVRAAGRSRHPASYRIGLEPQVFLPLAAVHTRHLVDDKNPSCGCESCRVSRALKEEYLRRGLFEAFPPLG
jgi:hypothetical protein